MDPIVLTVSIRLAGLPVRGARASGSKVLASPYPAADSDVGPVGVRVHVPTAGLAACPGHHVLAV